MIDVTQSWCFLFFKLNEERILSILWNTFYIRSMCKCQGQNKQKNQEGGGQYIWSDSLLYCFNEWLQIFLQVMATNIYRYTNVYIRKGGSTYPGSITQNQLLYIISILMSESFLYFRSNISKRSWKRRTTTYHSDPDKTCEARRKGRQGANETTTATEDNKWIYNQRGRKEGWRRKLCLCIYSYCYDNNMYQIPYIQLFLRVPNLRKLGVCVTFFICMSFFCNLKSFL